MRVAIVHPHPVPFGLGGAENLFWGLQDHLAAAGHRCDLIALAGRETTIEDLVEGYDAFGRLDLSSYDLVISGKYPAWMARHPRHVCWMLHRLRGLYDTYPGGDYDPAHLAIPAVAATLAWLRMTAGAGGLGEADGRAELLARLRRLRGDAPEALFAFPGPLAREVVRHLDDTALSHERIARFAAISRTVARRAGYFPAGADVAVLYPPPHRSDYRCGADDYLFTSSRLDGPKRIALLIEAMRHVDTDIPLLIAGGGPEEARLRALSAGDPRVRFLGFVPDDEMPSLYADALAVLFVPYDEDYGLVTIEAMRSAKPVLTVSDSGGPCEFVRDGETGLVATPEPRAIAARIRELLADRARAHAMGQAARRAIAEVTWERAAEGLLEAGVPRRRARPRRRLAVATTFPVFPPRGGGQARVFHLYRNIARDHDVDVVSLAPAGAKEGTREIAPGLVERRVARSRVHEAFERELGEAVGGVPVGDVASARLAATTPAYRHALAEACSGADVLIACHPFLARELAAVAPDGPLWLEAQDVEVALKRDAYGDGPAAERLLAEVRDLERFAWREARVAFACAADDLAELERIHGPTLARRLVVPNGVDVEAIPFLDLAARRRRQAAAGVPGRRLAVFVGSWHPPNLDAVETILSLARATPGIDFVVAGSVCLPFAGAEVPPNARLMGLVDDATRDALYALADVALNPMRFGSGTNLKMLDYFAAGLPVLSTPFGARGLSVAPGEHFVAAPVEDWPERLPALVAAHDADLDRMTRAARERAEEAYSWQRIAADFLGRVGDIL